MFDQEEFQVVSLGPIFKLCDADGTQLGVLGESTCGTSYIRLGICAYDLDICYIEVQCIKV